MGKAKSNASGRVPGAKERSRQSEGGGSGAAARQGAGSDAAAKRGTGSSAAAKRGTGSGAAAEAGKHKRSKVATTSGGESTEERIKEAARKLFTQKGFAATRTRDIAQEAGLNLALLNYYFRSKQKLFDLVMMENFRKFLAGMTVNFQDKTLSMEKRVEKIVTAYVDFLTEFPDLPLFILNEIQGNPSRLAAKVNEQVGPMRSQFFKELMESKKEGKVDLEPFHFVANLVGLTVFPFVSRPLLQRVTGVNDEQFNQLMQERKKLVPIWIGMMMRPGAGSGAAVVEAGGTRAAGSGAAGAGATGTEAGGTRETGDKK